MNNIQLSNGRSRNALTSSKGMSRRDVLRVSAAFGGGLLLTIGAPSLGSSRQADEVFSPGAFIRIDRSGNVTLTMSQVEMGQGTYTSMSMLIAEELEVEIDRVIVEHAPANEKLYGNPAIAGVQVTGGSTSVRAFWKPLRAAGAAAREMLIASAAEEWKVDPASCSASSGEVLHEPSGRKIGYGHLVGRAATRAIPDNVQLKNPKDFKLVGRPIKRVDAKSKTDGSAIYGIDVKLPGMKVATLFACPVAGGRVASIDDSGARKVKGVIDVVRLDDAVAVIADHMAAAKKGLDAVKIEWDPGPLGSVSTADLVRGLKDASSGPGIVAISRGNPAAEIPSTHRKIEAEYRSPLLAHAAMEPMNCTVHVRKDACDVWVGNQILGRAQAAAAAVTGLPLDKVMVHNHLIGGGFGRRLEIDGITRAVEIAKRVDYPVKVIWTREEDIQHDVYRPYYLDNLSAVLDEKKIAVSFSHRVTGPSILARWLPPAFKNGLDRDAVASGAGEYGFENVLVDYVRHEFPEAIATGFWRGVGVTHNAFVVEGFIDELASAANQDPVEYRRMLLGKASRARAVLEIAADKAGWASRPPQGTGRGVSVVFGFGTYLAQIAEVSVDKNGRVKVNRVVCAVDCGQVVNPDTVKAQIEGGIIFGISATLYGEITFKNGRVEQSNFDDYQVVRIDEAPKIEVYIKDSNEDPGGIGEPGTAAIAPAVVNAIFDLTGKRLRQLPVDANLLKTT